MRFAYAGIDMMSTVFATLLKAGWTPVKLFTRPMQQSARQQYACGGTGRQGRRFPPSCHRSATRISPILGRMARNVSSLPDIRGKVLGWEPHLPYALNFHPSPPCRRGGGPYPLMRALMEDRAEWGVTAHKLSPRFDAGDIIDRRELSRQPPTD